ncbi:Uncharacterized protein OBRU01_06402 [Operophtera brumata]|uniref:Transmembrane protein 127 transmembrane region domain-containing protein n=1 Tax=Operophtera brumata TaxID=104452 RepID=A0A0L7L898_OPEBR|nr:Uncharacterized protein OBRU01_06402 [Operophtera brumata]
MGCLTWIRGFKEQFPFKDKELNKIAAFFNLCTFLLTCAAIIQSSWFRIKGLHCTQILSLAHMMQGVYQTTIVLILLCFMVLLCSSVGTLINLTSLNSRAIRILRRNAVPSIMCVFWVIAIVGVCYYATVELGNGSGDSNAIQVDYEYGFYTITGAGALALLASAANLWGAPLNGDEDIQRRSLMDDWDGYEAHSVGPTPAVPALPPYSPSADYVPCIPPYAPPVLGSQQYFPFDDLSILPPPPPYTP